MDRAQKQKETNSIPEMQLKGSEIWFHKRKAIAATAAVVEEWNVKDRPWKALS